MRMSAFASSGGALVAQNLGTQPWSVGFSCGPDASSTAAVKLQVTSDRLDHWYHSLMSSDPGISGNEPILLGTRIRVALLYAMKEKAGMSIEQIASAYPHLTVEQIEDALAYAYENREEMEGYLARDETQEFIAGRPVVRAYDPDDWPYPPEPDCQKEWDEAEE